MVLPALIAGSSLAYSIIYPRGDAGDTGESTSTSRVRAIISYEGWLPLTYGVFLGLGLSSLVGSSFRRRRVWERIRVTLAAWWNTVDGTKQNLLEKYRKPTPLGDIDGTAMDPGMGAGMPLEKAPGIRRQVVSPDWAATSHLSVSTWTLLPGTELKASISPGVEFYFVLQGEGLCTKGGVDSLKLSSGSCFIVDPDCERSFKAQGRTSLVLLRAADAASEGNDVVARHAESNVSTAVASMKAGLSKVGTMVRNYSNREPATKKPETAVL